MNLCVERAGLHIREERLLGNLNKHQPSPSTTEHVCKELDLLRSERLALIKKEHLREITHYQEQVTTAIWGWRWGRMPNPNDPPKSPKGGRDPLGEAVERLGKR